jgi:hypothetical protein
MPAAIRRVTPWIIGIRDAVLRVAALATAEELQRSVCGHVRWSDGMPGPAGEIKAKKPP